MPYVIEWLENATKNLERIYMFWAAKDEEAARRVIAAIYHGSQSLEQFPYLGRPALDLDENFRELIIPFGDSGYVLLYRVEDNIIYILAIRHQKEAGFLW